jgi:hypothetical protein
VPVDAPAENLIRDLGLLNEVLRGAAPHVDHHRPLHRGDVGGLLDVADHIEDHLRRASREPDADRGVTDRRAVHGNALPVRRAQDSLFPFRQAIRLFPEEKKKLPRGIRPVLEGFRRPRADLLVEALESLLVRERVVDAIDHVLAELRVVDVRGAEVVEAPRGLVEIVVQVRPRRHDDIDEALLDELGERLTHTRRHHRPGETEHDDDVVVERVGPDPGRVRESSRLETAPLEALEERVACHARPELDRPRRVTQVSTFHGAPPSRGIAKSLRRRSSRR